MAYSCIYWYKDHLQVLSLLFISFFLCKAVEKIDVEPAMDFVIPLGTNVTLKCMQKVPGAILGWRAYLSNGTVRFGSLTQSDLAPLGIQLLYPNDNISILHFNGTDNRVVAVECRFFEFSTGGTVSSNRTNIIIVGPPPSPTNVTTALVGDILTIDWTVPTIPEVTLTFNVTLKTSSEERFVMTQNHSYQFTISEQTCFEVDILVFNIAGTNRTSVSGSVPVLHDSICYEVFAEGAIVFLIMSFKLPNCSTKESKNFLLQVMNLGNEDNSSMVTSTSRCTAIGSAHIVCNMDLLSNSKFNVSIVSSNASIITEPIKISSAKIQGVTVSHESTNYTHTVTCSFLAGSDVTGCSYTLIGTDSEANISGIIIRDRNSGSAQVNISDVDSYSEIVAYEVDSNNMTIYDSQPFRTFNIFEETRTQMCLFQPVQDSTATPPITVAVNTSPGGPSGDSMKFLITVIASTAGGTFFVVLAIIFFIVVCYSKGKRSKFVKEELQSSAQEFSSEALYNTLSKNGDNGSMIRRVVDDNTYSRIDDNAIPIYHVLESNTPQHLSESDTNVTYEEVHAIRPTVTQETSNM